MKNKQYTIQELDNGDYIVTLFINGEYQCNYACNNQDSLADKVNELMAQGYHRGYSNNDLYKTEILIAQIENLYEFQKKNKVKS